MLAHSRRARPGAGHHILHLAADADLGALIELSLGLDPGLRVTSAGFDYGTLQRLGPLRPDLILLDAAGMAPAEALARLRLWPHLRGAPVAFVVARARRGEAERCLAAGAMAVIETPFNPLTLAGSVRLLLEPAPQRAAG